MVEVPSVVPLGLAAKVENDDLADEAAVVLAVRGDEVAGGAMFALAAGGLEAEEDELSYLV